VSGIRIIAIGGEYGNALVEAIARAADVDCGTARRYDECIDSWFHRLRKALWHGGYEGVASTTESGFDTDAMAALARRRGGQCILQGRRDAFHVFVYGPRRERIGRIGWDRRREAYIRRHFGQEWTNPHLYGLMLCSSMAETAAVAAILAAVRS
jgi:hypothetical protein